MTIGSKEVLIILKKNFDFEVHETVLGETILMDPFSAFIYSSVTGSSYLTNPVFPFSPKGSFKVFYNACNYNMVTGLFENASLYRTPYNLYKKKKFLFEGNKKILPVEFDSEDELQRKYKNFIEILKDNDENPENYIIQRVETSKKGNGMEPFLEYLATEYLKREGYIVETQIPLSHSEGIPDLGGYRIFTSESDYEDNKLIDIYGLNIIELSLIRLGLKNRTGPSPREKSILVGEAKSSTKNMAVQLDKYLETGKFDRAYEIHPFKKSPSKSYFGLIRLDKSFNLESIKPDKTFTHVRKEERKTYVKWLKNYIKYFLIANLTNDELKKYYKEKFGENISNEEDLIKFINSLEYEDIINRIKKVV